MESLKVALIPLIILFTLCVLGITISAFRNKVMFKMGARNVPRRIANTVLTCLGLMLAAMIFSASFTTGDTLEYSIRSVAVEYLGETDIVVMKEGGDFGVFQDQALESNDNTKYFDQDYVSEIEQILGDRSVVDGIAPAIIEIVPVVSESTSLNEPAVTLLAFDHQYMEPFDPLLNENGKEISVKSLESMGEGYVYVNSSLAEALEVGIGDELTAYFNLEGVPLTVAGIYETGGNPASFNFDSTNASMVAPLSSIQSLRTQIGGPGDINYILITNQGGSLDGAQHTDTVMDALESSVDEMGLKAEPIKQDTLDEADEGGAMFSTMFLVFGSFSIIAGILLIFLIFVMLAAERKQELGIARAVGTQRGHVVRLFTFEGAIYALIASAIGSAMGLLISWGMVEVMSSAFEEMGFKMVFHFTPSGLILSYTLGVVFTLLVVFFSARRVSRLNIICAIKDIPEPQKTGGRSIKGLIFAIVSPTLGLLMLTGGLMAKQWAPYTLGASLLIIGVCMLARRFGLPDRPAYSMAGFGLLIFWLMPFDIHPYSDEMSSGIEMFILSGTMLVAGGVWVVMYNSDLLLSGIMTLFGRVRTFTPIIKTAVSYPMASRFRTGMALAMFALVIFTLIVMSTLNASFDRVLNDTDRVAGGFHIRANTMNPVVDMGSAIVQSDRLNRNDFQAIASFNTAQIKIRDVNEDTDESNDVEWEELILVGADAGYSQNVNYNFELMTEEFTSSEQVWRALTENPSLAVVNTAVVPTKENEMGEREIDLIIGEGQYYLQDDILPDDVYIEVQNYSGNIHRLRVIGVVDMMAFQYAPFVTTSQDTLNTIVGQRSPTSFRFQLNPERISDESQIATDLEKSFMEYGMNTEVMAEEIKDFGKLNEMFMNLMMAFMGLGLIVGIAALGVIAARSVVERRQQIGMLRAIGFRQGMVQLSFTIESSFISLLGIFLGVALGLALAYQLIPDSGIEGMTTVIPWSQIIFIVTIAYIASLLTTFLPAYQASKIYPAEALRYE
ncbi:MAG: FtsX-like permease family protein [Planctomycetes bacterium]|nr:FtsX-like permease family protein [Planctomycetota bacterium]